MNDEDLDPVKEIMGKTLDQLHEHRICTFMYNLVSGPGLL
jgi:hypothetical protein